MTTSSARPRDLHSYRDHMRGADADLVAQARALGGLLAQAQASSDRQFLGALTDIDIDVARHAQTALQRGDWVGGVGDAFATADNWWDDTATTAWNGALLGMTRIGGAGVGLLPDVADFVFDFLNEGVQDYMRNGRELKRWAAGWGWLHRAGLPARYVGKVSLALAALGAVLRYDEAGNAQLDTDASRNDLTWQQRAARAQTAGVIGATASTVGSVGGAAIGGLALGAITGGAGAPIGAAIGGVLGGMAGDWVGDGIIDATLQTGERQRDGVGRIGTAVGFLMPPPFNGPVGGYLGNKVATGLFDWTHR